MTTQPKHTPTLFCTKYCCSCKIEKNNSDFYKSNRSKSGLQTYCKTCQNIKDKSNPILRKQRANRYKFNKPAESSYRHFVKRAKENSVPCINRDEFCKWYYEQELKCEYCGVNQETAHSLYKHGLHIDRKVGELGYVAKNMVFACQRCNLVKNGYLTHQQMLEVAAKYFNGTYVNAHDALVEQVRLLERTIMFQIKMAEHKGDIEGVNLLMYTLRECQEALKQAGAE